tara:strand:+ start:311 stop:544 length:234 start_codon:yes stop_codon:yes gene_type:complete
VKITKAQIKKIIKEELLREYGLQDADPIEVFGAFKLIDIKLDNLKRATSFATPEEILEDISNIRLTVEKLRQLVTGQ